MTCAPSRPGLVSSSGKAHSVPAHYGSRQCRLTCGNAATAAILRRAPFAPAADLGLLGSELGVRFGMVCEALCQCRRVTDGPGEAMRPGKEERVEEYSCRQRANWRLTYYRRQYCLAGVPSTTKSARNLGDLLRVARTSVTMHLTWRVNVISRDWWSGSGMVRADKESSRGKLIGERHLSAGQFLQQVQIASGPSVALPIGK